MKTFKIPKEQSAYVCIPVMKDGAQVDASTLTAVTVKLRNASATETQLTSEALGYSGIVAKIEDAACGSYRIKVQGTNAAGVALTAECLLEIVHYDSQVNVTPTIYKTLPCYILSDDTERPRIEGVEAR